MSSTTDQPTTPGAPPPTEKKRDRTHFLYMAVIVAMLAGIAVGFLFPDFGVQLKPLGTFFVNLIKMMIGPIIFVTIVLGIGSVKRAAQVGKVGGLALGYFVTMSTVALAVGLVVGNIVKPGPGSTSPTSSRRAARTPSRPRPSRRPSSSSASCPTPSSRR